MSKTYRLLECLCVDLPICNETLPIYRTEYRTAYQINSCVALLLAFVVATLFLLVMTFRRHLLRLMFLRFFSVLHSLILLYRIWCKAFPSNGLPNIFFFFFFFLCEHKKKTRESECTVLYRYFECFIFLCILFFHLLETPTDYKPTFP